MQFQGAASDNLDALKVVGGGRSGVGVSGRDAERQFIAAG